MPLLLALLLAASAGLAFSAAPAARPLAAALLVRAGAGFRVAAREPAPAGETPWDEEAEGHGWHSASDPDPTGSTDRAVRDYLASIGQEAKELALFCDFACLPQPPRSADEQAMFDRGLLAMGSFYASLTGTTVLQRKIIPDRPPEFDGRIIVFPPPGGLTEHQKTPEALKRHFSKFGEVVDCDPAPDGRMAVRFKEHSTAETAAKMAGRWPVRALAAVRTKTGDVGYGARRSSSFEVDAIRPLAAIEDQGRRKSSSTRP